MTYRVELKPKAEKDLKDLAPPERKRVVAGERVIVYRILHRREAYR